MQPYSHKTIQKVHRCPVIRYSLSVGRPSARQPQSHKIHRFVAVSSLAAPFFLLVLPSGHRTKWLPSLPPALPRAFLLLVFKRIKKALGSAASLHWSSHFFPPVRAPPVTHKPTARAASVWRRHPSAVVVPLSFPRGSTSLGLG